jgi:hypothetical protein
VTDIYAAPHAELRRTPRLDSWGSVERGIVGDYELSIRGVLREAWEKTDGAKLPINGAMVIYMLFVMATVFLPEILMGDGDVSTPPTWQSQVAQQLLSQLVGAPLYAGLFMIGLRRAVGAPIRASVILGQLHKAVPLFITNILMSLLVMIGFVLLIIPGIYLAVAYQCAMGLVADKNLGPWQALETSRKAIGKHWFRALGLGLALLGINVLTILTLFIGLIWTVPMSLIAVGVFYRTVFGCEPESTQEG